MTNNETLADIAREMRTYFQAQKRNGNPEHRPWHKVLSDWADRIEAAAKREMAKGLSKKLDGNRSIPGNVAVMSRWLKTIQNMSEHNDNDLGNTVVRGLLDQLTRIHTCAREALAAPPRNCDRYRTEEEALKAWDGLDENDAGDWFAFTDWLFAPAKEGK